jgi:transcriptional regulator with XRE-family HTH domain
MDWQRLAQAVIDRRVELGYRTRESFAAETGLSSRLLGDLERAQRDNFDRVTLARLEQALQWEPGTARAFLTKGTASALPEDDDPDPLEAKLERLPLLAQGLNPTDRRRLADSVQLLLEWVDARHGVPEMTAEERERLEQFQRTTRALNKATAEHAEQQPVPPMSNRRQSEVRTNG